MTAIEKEILVLDGVTKAFHGLIAVNRLSTKIMPLEIRAIIGPNGAGKTTLFNLITGQLPLDAGRVVFDDEDISGLSPHRICKRRIGRTFQITSIFPKLTVSESIQTAILTHEGKTVNPISRAKKLALDKTVDLMISVGLSDRADKVSGELSLGDQKLLEIAIALAGEPKLLLLDEPTAGMATYERRELMELVTRIVGEHHLTVLFIEHDMDVVFSRAHKISVMHQGKIIAEDTPDRIRENRDVQGVYLG